MKILSGIFFIVGSLLNHPGFAAEAMNTKPNPESLITPKRLSSAQKEPENWITYSGDYSGRRFSSLDQVNKKNVSKLRPIWVYQTEESGRLESSPLVANGVMYVTEYEGRVDAIDLLTGRRLWTFKRPVPANVRNCCGLVNRGAAIHGDKIFFGTSDAWLYALDVSTGAVRWKVELGDYNIGYHATVAPLVVKDKVIMGISGGEHNARGFLDAYDVETGAKKWRLWTIPQKGEPASETWGNEPLGGGTTWVTGVYDPELNLIYWNTGNPGEAFNGKNRPGDNLYTNCMLAVDADTGKLKWHFQFTPHDTHDYDANQTPIILDAKMGGEMKKLIVTANRNGYYYILERTSGKFLSATSFVPTDWAKGIDSNGRPFGTEGRDPSKSGTTVTPGQIGVINYNPPTYSPETGLIYLFTQNTTRTFFSNDVPYKVGDYSSMGGGTPTLTSVDTSTILALNALDGKKVWDFKLNLNGFAGLLSTAGGLVFSGTREGYLIAFDDQNGKPLWRFNTGGNISAPPITYFYKGKQYVAVGAFRSFYVFGLD